MAKGFTKTNPLNNFGTTHSREAADQRQQDDTPVSVPDATPAPAPVKKKPGRPKTKDIKNTCRGVNVMLPISLLDQWDKVKAVHGNNLTAYITKLIDRDMQANFDRYKAIADELKNI